jgi:hypothetical protein
MRTVGGSSGFDSLCANKYLASHLLSQLGCRKTRTSGSRSEDEESDVVHIEHLGVPCWLRFVPRHNHSRICPAKMHTQAGPVLGREIRHGVRLHRLGPCRCGAKSVGGSPGFDSLCLNVMSLSSRFFLADSQSPRTAKMRPSSPRHERTWAEVLCPPVRTSSFS